MRFTVPTAGGPAWSAGYRGLPKRNRHYDSRWLGERFQRRWNVHDLLGAEGKASTWEAMITSPPDRENVVFEIWCGNREVAEISKAPGREYEIELYAAPEAGAWHFDLNEFRTMIERGIGELASNR